MAKMRNIRLMFCMQGGIADGETMTEMFTTPVHVNTFLSKRSKVWLDFATQVSAWRSSVKAPRAQAFDA